MKKGKVNVLMLEPQPNNGIRTIDTTSSQTIAKPNVSGSLIIELNDWDHTCGDGCCYTYGTDIYLNGEKLDEQNAEDSKNALIAVLEKLGYKVDINYR